MARPQTSQAIRYLLVGLAAWSAVACSSPPETGLLRNYFTASRVRDNVTLGNIATVEFSPTEQGVVEDFDVVSSAPDEVKTLRVKELSDAVAEAQKAQEDYSKRKREYQDANIEAIGRVIKAEAAGTQLRGKDAEIQAEWTKWRNDEGDFARKLNDARKALTEERSIADVSLAGKNVDLTQVPTDLTTREVTVQATVKTPQGASEARNLLVRIQKASAKSTPQVEGKWIITSVRPA